MGRRGGVRTTLPTGSDGGGAPVVPFAPLSAAGVGNDSVPSRLLVTDRRVPGGGVQGSEERSDDSTKVHDINQLLHISPLPGLLLLQTASWSSTLSSGKKLSTVRKVVGSRSIVTLVAKHPKWACPRPWCLKQRGVNPTRPRRRARSLVLTALHWGSCRGRRAFFNGMGAPPPNSRRCTQSPARSPPGHVPLGEGSRAPEKREV